MQIRILQFFLMSKASLLYNTMISLSYLSDGRDLSMFMKSFMRISRISLKTWHRGKKCNVVSVSMLQEHNGFTVSSKLCRNLCPHKWLNPNLNLVSNFIPSWSWMLKILFPLGLIKFSTALWKLIDKIDNKIGSFVYRNQVCSTPLWHTVKKSFRNTRSCNKKK